MSSTQEKLESEISKYTAGYDSGLEGEQSMLCITRHDKEQDTIVAMYRGEEADIIQAVIDSAKREGRKETVELIVDMFKQAGMISSGDADMVLGRMRELIKQSEESEE